MTAPAFGVQIEWHSPDQVFAAVLVRDGEPWYLGGALVGMGSTPGGAVDELAGAARYLVIHGQNYLTGGALLPLADREWLFSLLAAAGLERDDEMYTAIRAARAAGRIIGGQPRAGAESSPAVAAGVTLAAVGAALRDAGHAEAAVYASGTRAANGGWRGWERDGMVWLSYWPADNEYDGTNLDAPGHAEREATWIARYATTLHAVGFTVASAPGVITVTGAPTLPENRAAGSGDLATWASEHPDLVEDATKFARGRKTVWASLIQRHVRVGYARAVILLDVLEQRGVVGPAGSTGKRDVLPPSN